MLRKRTRKSQSDEEFNPLSSLANMADVMFVLSVGLLVALASVWNVNPASSGSSGKPKQATVNVKEGKALQNLPQIDSSTGTGYEQMGTVFKDPKTGKLIMVQPEEEGGNK